MQTHHSIKTACKLVPGIFYRIFLFKKMLCCAMLMKLGCYGRWFMVFNAPFNNISVSFIGGEKWSTRRKPLTRLKSLTHVIT